MPTKKESRIVSRGRAPVSKFISLAPPTIIEQIDHRFGPTLYKLPRVAFPRESSLPDCLVFPYSDRQINFLFDNPEMSCWLTRKMPDFLTSDDIFHRYWHCEINSYCWSLSFIFYWNINRSFKLVTVAGKRKTKQFPMHAPIYMWHTPAGNKSPFCIN